MRHTSAGLVVLALLLTALLYAVGSWYAQDRGIPTESVALLLPAFCVELILYVLAGVPAFRAALQRLPPVTVGLGLTALGPLSYILLSNSLNSFSVQSALIITAMAAAGAFWYVVLPRHPAVDAGFLVVMALPVLFNLFDLLYPDPARRVPGQSLGVLMWYRTGLISALCIRQLPGVGFGFLPHRSEWAIGIRNYLWFTPPALAIALAIGFVRVREVVWDARFALLTLLTFAGVLWVLAVAEEFFFRGLLQQQLTKLFRSNTAGLIVASVIFGSAHLAYREFPNWRFAVLATIAGLFYGRAYLQAGSIRAAMVTHALVVTTWKMFFV